MELAASIMWRRRRWRRRGWLWRCLRLTQGSAASAGPEGKTARLVLTSLAARACNL